MPSSDRLHVSVPAGTSPPRHGWIVSRHADRSRTFLIWLEEWQSHVPVTHPLGLLQESAAHLSFLDSVVLADELLARAGTASLQLRNLWQADASRHPFLRKVVLAARPGAESPMESRTRLLVTTGGLPEPVAQHEVRLHGRRRRLDLAYPEYKIAIEYHFSGAAQRHADVLRDEALLAAGWIIVRDSCRHDSVTGLSVRT